MRAVQPSFLGGNQIATNKFLVRPDDLALALNVSNPILGAWKTRPGTAKVGGTLVTGNTVTGLFGDETGSGKLLAVINNSGDTQSVLKYNNAGTWTDISGATTLPAGVVVNCLNFLDFTYIFGVTPAGTFMTTGKLSGTTYSDPSFPKAAFGNVYNDQVYLADCEVSGVRYRNRAYFGSIPAYSGGWSFSFTTATDYLQFSTNDGDFLTGVAKSFGYNLFFKNYSLWGIDANQNQFQIDGIGCTDPRSIVSIDDKNVYFAHISKKDTGIFRFDGTGAKKISRAVEPWLKGCSTAIAGGYDDGHIYMSLGDVTLDADIAEYYGLDSSYSNVILDYSADDDIWIVHSLPFAVSVMAPFGNDLYLGTTDGRVGQWGSGTTDMGTAITSTIITHNFYGSSQLEFNARKAWNEQIVNMHEPNSAAVYRSIDNAAWYSVDAAMTQKVNAYSANGKGYGIRTKITGDFIFEGVEYGYNLERPLK